MDSFLLFVGIMSSGLMAGLFFGWAVSVNLGLARVSDRTYIATMQSINRAIVNPIFVVVFMGTAVALLAAAVVHAADGQGKRATWLFAAAGTYILGVLGVTIGGNIPLNDKLEAFSLEDSPDEAISDQRHGYEAPWVRWHNVRTVASVLALALAAIGAVIEDA